MERCWHETPSTRPHIAEILAMFEADSRGWTSPTSEAIANLGLNQLTSQATTTMEFAFTTSRAAFGMVGAGLCEPPRSRAVIIDA
jgi:hypothetical protein